jgi:hypothetical protein
VTGRWGMTPPLPTAPLHRCTARVPASAQHTAPPHPRGLAQIAARGAAHPAHTLRRPPSESSARFCTPAESTHPLTQATRDGETLRFRARILRVARRWRRVADQVVSVATQQRRISISR